MTKSIPLPFYDEFMAIFKNHTISNWEAKDFVKLIVGNGATKTKKDQFEIYKALKILVRCKYLTIDPSQSTKKRFSYSETELMKDLREKPLHRKLAQIFEAKEIELLQQIQEKESNIIFIQSLCNDNPEIAEILKTQIDKLNDDIRLIKNNISLMENIFGI